MSTLPEWATPGTPVVECGAFFVVRAVIVRITPTGIVRLDNGATYRPRSDYGRTLLKTGEKGPWIGHNRPTSLVSAADYQRSHSQRIVAGVRAAVAAVQVRGREPAEVLAEIEDLVAAGKARLDRLDRETRRAVAAASEGSRS